MKKVFLLGLMLCSTTIFAQQDDAMSDDQTSEESMDNMSNDRDNYNHWSIDAGVGFHKPTRQFATGAFASTPSFFQAELGARYMINNKFGFSAELGYGDIENSESSDVRFNTNFTRLSLEGVLNLGEVLGFRSWTQSFNLLGHGGLGVSRISAQPLGLNDVTEVGSHATVGLTPQFKLTDRISLYGDFSLIGNIDQDITWDGTMEVPDANSRGFDAAVYNVTFGVNIYLGSNTVHADWYSADTDNENRIADLENEVGKLITDLTDDDQDGVPNYLDRDNDTESGVAVDSKGRAIDVNKNGIPDELEPALKSQYVSKDEFANFKKGGVSQEVMKQLIDQGYVNVFFKFNSTKVEGYSLNSLNSMVNYLKLNSSATATLTGYADELGSEEYNKDLSMRRANRIKDVMVAAGIDASRINTVGQGEDTSVNKENEAARFLVRRVSISLN